MHHLQTGRRHWLASVPYFFFNNNKNVSFWRGLAIRSNVFDTNDNRLWVPLYVLYLIFIYILYMFTIYLYLVNHMALRKYLIKWPYEMTSRDMLFFTFKISVAIIKFFSSEEWYICVFLIAFPSMTFFNCLHKVIWNLLILLSVAVQ